MMWQIDFHDDVEDRLLAMPNGIQARMFRLLEMIETHGPNLGAPHTKPLDDGLFEIRAKARERMKEVKTNDKSGKLKKRAFTNKSVKREYDALAPEFELMDKLLTMRSKAGLTQKQIADRMNTSISNISRLESGRANPSWQTLTRYANACGERIGIQVL